MIKVVFFILSTTLLRTRMSFLSIPPPPKRDVHGSACPASNSCWVWFSAKSASNEQEDEKRSQTRAAHDPRGLAQARPRYLRKKKGQRKKTPKHRIR